MSASRGRREMEVGPTRRSSTHGSRGAMRATGRDAPSGTVVVLGGLAGEITARDTRSRCGGVGRHRGSTGRMTKWYRCNSCRRRHRFRVSSCSLWCCSSEGVGDDPVATAAGLGPGRASLGAAKRVRLKVLGRITWLMLTSRGAVGGGCRDPPGGVAAGSIQRGRRPRWLPRLVVGPARSAPSSSRSCRPSLAVAFEHRLAHRAPREACVALAAMQMPFETRDRRQVHRGPRVPVQRRREARQPPRGLVGRCDRGGAADA